MLVEKEPFLTMRVCTCIVTFLWNLSRLPSTVPILGKETPK